MNPVLIVFGILAIGAGLVLEQIEKKKQLEKNPPVIEETDAEKTARLAAEAKDAEANHNGDNNGSGNGADSRAISEAEATADKGGASIHLDD